MPINLGAALLIAISLGFSNSAIAADLNPLRPPDTSSPRATVFQGFVASIDEAYLRMSLADNVVLSVRQALHNVQSAGYRLISFTAH